MKLEFMESQSEYTDRPLFFFGRLKSVPTSCASGSA